MSPVSAADEQKLMKKLQQRAKMLADTVGQLEELKQSQMVQEQKPNVDNERKSGQFFQC